MILQRLILKNFRNHKNFEIDFDKQVNLITGPNGIGKTNILEAINFVATTKSFRAKYDRDLIMYESAFAGVEAKVKPAEDNDYDTLQIQIVKTDRSEHTSKKKVMINKVAKGLGAFSHYFKCVLFSPEDIDIITGTPSLRRKYMDALLYQVDPQYKKSSIAYQKAVRRRNKILELIRETSNGYDQLPYWNNKLLEHAEYIQQKRFEWQNFTNEYLQERGSYATNLKAIYTPNTMNTTRLKEYQPKEIAAKTTLIGPHRDDFYLTQDGKDMAQFASRGEQRTAIFLVKLAEFSYIKMCTQVKPILLLDDIFSELDKKHREAILSFITDNQTIITSASTKELPEVYISKTISLFT